jgi:hypothetical protein
MDRHVAARHEVHLRETASGNQAVIGENHLLLEPASEWRAAAGAGAVVRRRAAAAGGDVVAAEQRGMRSSAWTPASALRNAAGSMSVA